MHGSFGCESESDEKRFSRNYYNSCTMRLKTDLKKYNREQEREIHVHVDCYL